MGILSLQSRSGPAHQTVQGADQPTGPTLSASSPLNTKTVPRDTLLEGTILAVERREKNFVTLTLTVRESCSVGIYVCVNMCVHVPALPKANAPWAATLLAPPQYNP
jgi:hypothetical protein